LNYVQVSRLLDSSDFHSSIPYPMWRHVSRHSSRPCRWLPRVCILCCSQSWFLQHQVRLCLETSTNSFRFSNFSSLSKLCLVYFPDAVGVSRLGKARNGLYHGCSNLKPGSGRQFNLWIVAVIIRFTLESARSWLYIYIYGQCICNLLYYNANDWAILLMSCLFDLNYCIYFFIMGY
jgi:hypothetical protein